MRIAVGIPIPAPTPNARAHIKGKLGVRPTLMSIIKNDIMSAMKAPINAPNNRP
jgi:hypothetical protein